MYPYFMHYYYTNGELHFSYWNKNIFHQGLENEDFTVFVILITKSEKVNVNIEHTENNLQHIKYKRIMVCCPLTELDKEFVTLISWFIFCVVTNYSESF